MLVARLFRPHVPVAVRQTVATRQLGDAIFVQRLHRNEGESASAHLARLLSALAGKLGCAIEDLRLDHDPPLAMRPQFRRGLGKKTYYEPDANDPKHLFYRPHGTQFEGSHDVKTRIRGDHGQYSDVVLIKRARRQERKVNFISSADKSKPKMKRRAPGLSPCARVRNGLPCHCKADPQRWRRRKVVCGNWRTTKIQSRKRS